jgi:hypothetical protein
MSEYILLVSSCTLSAEVPDVFFTMRLLHTLVDILSHVMPMNFSTSNILATTKRAMACTEYRVICAVKFIDGLIMHILKRAVVES